MRGGLSAEGTFKPGCSLRPGLLRPPPHLHLCQHVQNTIPPLLRLLCSRAPSRQGMTVIRAVPNSSHLVQSPSKPCHSHPDRHSPIRSRHAVSHLEEGSGLLTGFPGPALLHT